jgi:hypothetical protein
VDDLYSIKLLGRVPDPPLIAETARNEPVSFGRATAKYVRGDVDGIERGDVRYVLPPKVRTLRLFRASSVNIGLPTLTVALYPFPDLSFHCVTVVDPGVLITVDVSAASSHRTHPDTENVVANVFPISDRSDHDVTCPVVVDEMVVVACASNHRDRPGRREGINLSSFKTFAMIYTTSVMYLPEIYVAFITF